MNEILAFTAKKIRPCPRILLITPTQTILRIVREALKERGEEVSQLQLIADSIPLYISKNFSILGPVVGSVAIDLALEPLLISAIDEVRLLSIAGASGDKFSIGQIVYPENFAHITTLLSTGTLSTQVLSIDNPYLENESYFEKYYCELIDMEGASIESLSRKYQKPFKASYCISDIWNSDGKWIHGFGAENFQASLKQAAREIIKDLL